MIKKFVFLPLMVMLLTGCGLNISPNTEHTTTNKYPVIYVIQKEDFYRFINNKTVDCLEDTIKNGTGQKCTYRLHNGFIEYIDFSEPDNVKKNIKFNEGTYIIDDEYFRFWKENNLKKLIKKYLHRDINIDSVTMIRPLNGNDTGGELIAWIKSGDENYFVTRNKSLKKNPFFEKYASKSYYINSNFNCIGVYDEDQFNEKYAIKNAKLCDAKGTVIDDKNTVLMYGYAFCPVDKFMECLGFSTKWVDSTHLEAKKDSDTYLFTLETNGNVFYVDCAKNGKQLDDSVWTFVYGRIINGKYLLSSDTFSEIFYTIEGSYSIDYDKNIVNINGGF